MEIPRGWGVSKAKILKGKLGLNSSFQRGGGIQTKKPSVGGVWIFSGTTQYNFLDIYSHFFSAQSITKQAPNLYFFFIKAPEMPGVDRK